MKTKLTLNSILATAALLTSLFAQAQRGPQTPVTNPDVPDVECTLEGEGIFTQSVSTYRRFVTLATFGTSTVENYYYDALKTVFNPFGPLGVDYFGAQTEISPGIRISTPYENFDSLDVFRLNIYNSQDLYAKLLRSNSSAKTDLFNRANDFTNAQTQLVSLQQLREGFSTVVRVPVVNANGTQAFVRNANLFCATL